MTLLRSVNVIELKCEIEHTVYIEVGFHGFDVFHVFLPKLCEFIHISLEYDPADITRWISPHIRRFSTAYTSFEENTQF